MTTCRIDQVRRAPSREGEGMGSGVLPASGHPASFFFFALWTGAALALVGVLASRAVSSADSPPGLPTEKPGGGFDGRKISPSDLRGNWQFPGGSGFPLDTETLFDSG